MAPLSQGFVVVLSSSMLIDGASGLGVVENGQDVVGIHEP